MSTPRKDLTTTEDDIAAVLHASLSKVSRQLRHIDLPPGLTPERLRTLATIHANGPISVTALATMEQVRPATISRMISSLEEDGYVKRREDKSDKRGVLVVTTSKGRQMYLRANRQYLNQLNEALAKLDPEQVDMVRKLAEMLGKLNAALDR
jgi:DNA-binding MarR family transcriptional regulator